MGIHIGIEHRTTYRFDRAVQIDPQVVRLRPAPHCRTPILAYSLHGHAERALRQLAAGPVRQLPGPAGVPGAGDASSTITVDLVADLTVINPFDFFVEESAKRVPVRLRTASSRSDLEPYLRPAGPIEPRLQRMACPATTSPAAAHADRRLPRRDSTSGSTRDIDLHGPHGAGRADARRDARLEASVPAGTAAWLLVQVAAAPRARRPVRVGIPRAADRRPTVADGADGPERRTSPTSTPGPRSTSPAPAGSASTRRRGCSPARATSRSRARRIPSTAAPITGTTEPCEVTFEFSNVVHRVHEDPRVTLPYTDDAVGAHRRARRTRRSTSAWTPATCASRWAASRRSCRSTTWRAPSGTRPPTARRSARCALDLTLRLRQTGSRPAG